MTKQANRTELVFIVDRSGSMSGMELDTIGGLNTVLDENRQLDGKVTVSTIFFNTKTKVLHDRVDISKVANLKREDYRPSGCTALLDAVGGSIKHIDRVQKYMPKSHKADKVIFVITTDGLENSSKHYTYDKVKKAIEKKTEKGWEFLFLGANIDAAAEAGRMGIGADRAIEYCCDTEGTQAMYSSVAEATCCMRQAEACAPIDDSWMHHIKADKKRRGW